MSSAQITVAIPTYNRAALLARALESVLAQDIDGLEVFVADNASSDDTDAVVGDLDDGRVTLAKLPVNRGPQFNFSRALRLGSAPLVTLLQDDDLMLPGNLRRKVDVLDAAPDVAFVHSAFKAIDPHDEEIRAHEQWMRSTTDVVESGDEFIRRSLEDGARALFSAVVYRRALTDSDALRPEDRRPCELGLFLRLGRLGSVAYLDEPLVARRVHESSTTLMTGDYRVTDTGMQASVGATIDVAAVKYRFLREFGDTLTDAAELRRVTRRATREHLARALDEETWPGRPRWPTLLLAARAARAEPSVVSHHRFHRAIAAAVVGARARSMVRERRAR